MSNTTLGDLKLFSGADQSENFANINRFVPVRDMPAATTPQPWPVGAAFELPETFAGPAAEQSVAEFIARTSTSALLVLKDGEIRSENYYNHGGPDVRWLSMSVAKSFVSAMVGALVTDGTIGSIDEPISDYIDVNPGSAYDGVSIRDVLTMSSGARWLEEYSNPECDVMKLGRAMAGVEGDLDGFIASMVREFEPGTVCRYNSADTQALTLLICKSSGKNLSQVMTETLIEPLGFEQPGYWQIDRSEAGREGGYGGLSITARDFARIGELFRNGGNWHGTQVLPEQWVRDSTTVTSAQCADLDFGESHPPVGYGFQWWLTGPGTAYSAIGVYNQFVYVEPELGVTIVKLSANPTYGTAETDEVNLEGENLALLHALAVAVAAE